MAAAVVAVTPAATPVAVATPTPVARIEAPVEGGAVAAASPSKDWRFEKGEELAPGRYAVRLLGGGERYETYLAWDDRLFSLVVVKIVRPHLVEDGHALRSLAEEARLVASLEHPVVVRSFDAVLDGPRPHLVLEHLDGPRLSTLVRRYGPLAREQLLPLGLQLCSALHYLGGEGIVHLDVKPSNIIMGAPARLIDLSIARPVDELATSRHQVGTDAYMAPEQCDPVELGPVGSAADIWGVGATLYHAVSGRAPFPNRDEAEDRYPQLRESVPPLPDRVPEDVRALIASCLTSESAERPTPAELASELELLVDGLPRRLVLGRFRVRVR
jgi:serine/threonine protein kinase